MRTGVLAALAVAIVLALAVCLSPDEGTPLAAAAPFRVGGRPAERPSSILLGAPAAEVERLVPARPFAEGRDQSAGGLTAEVAPTPDAELAILIDDLRDDDVRFNAATAGWKLTRLLDRPVDRPACERALLAALDSSDFQQRYLAAMALWEAEPACEHPRLLAVSVDMLCNGRLRGSPRAMDEVRRNQRSPVNQAIDFLLQHAEAAEPLLVPLLAHHADEEARFLAAFVLALGGRTHLADRLAPALIPRLVDNSLAQDAQMAMNALVALGDRALWWLQRDNPRDDQQRACRALVMARLRAGRDLPDDEAAALNVVTRTQHNPLRGWRFRWYRSRSY